MLNIIQLKPGSHKIKVRTEMRQSFGKEIFNQAIKFSEIAFSINVSYNSDFCLTLSSSHTKQRTSYRRCFVARTKFTFQQKMQF